MRTEMKKLVSIIAAALAMASCEIETAGTGGLYANWQLQSVDTIATGGSCDMSRSNIYWAFESDVMQIRKQTSADGMKLLFSFTHAGDSIMVTNALYAHLKDSLSAVEDKSALAPFGFTDLTEKFKIQKNTGGRLVIENSAYRMTFRKY